jgi:hypothetical protein
MPDYSRPHFSDSFLGAFGNERTGSLESELPPADQSGPIATQTSPNPLLKIVLIVVVAAVVYFLLKKLTEAHARALLEEKDVPSLPG